MAFSPTITAAAEKTTRIGCDVYQASLNALRAAMTLCNSKLDKKRLDHTNVPPRTRQYSRISVHARNRAFPLRTPLVLALSSHLSLPVHPPDGKKPSRYPCASKPPPQSHRACRCEGWVNLFHPSAELLTHICCFSPSSSSSSSPPSIYSRTYILGPGFY